MYNWYTSYKGDNKNDINPFCPDAYSPLHVHWRLDICASSADSDEMSHLTAFHLVLHFLQEWHFTCIRKRKQNKKKLSTTKLFQKGISDDDLDKPRLVI